MTRTPAVTVIIETFNLTEGTPISSLRRAAVAALEQLEPVGGEVVVADHGRLDERVRSELRQLSAAVRIIDVTSDRYDEAKSEAVEGARSETVVLLDSDCEPEPGWLEAHLATLEHAVASAGLTTYRGGWLAKVLTVTDFGFLYEGLDVASCYASNNAAFRRDAWLATPPRGTMRCNCYLHAQDLLRNGTPLHVTSDARVTHDLPPLVMERFRRGADWVDAARDNPALGEARLLEGGVLSAFKFYELAVLDDFRRLRDMRRPLDLGALGTGAAAIALPVLRLVDLVGAAVALRRPAEPSPPPPRPIQRSTPTGVPPVQIEGEALSICIVSAHRSSQLEACLRALATQVAQPDVEVLVAANGDVEVEAVVREAYPDAKVVHVGATHPGAARNALLEHASHEFLVFLDDDVVPPPTFLRGVAELTSEHPECGVFGGPNETPPGSSPFEVIQGAVLASKVGGGIARERFGTPSAGPADDRNLQLCNLVVRRSAMLPFEDDLVCAEENALLHKLGRSGVQMWHDPRLAVWHSRRATIKGFAKQAHKFGRGRGQLLHRNPQTFRPAYLAPSALLGWSAFAAVTFGRRSKVVTAPLKLYGAAVGASSIKIAVDTRQVLGAPRAAVLTAVLHGGYGSGVARGWLAAAARRTRG